MKREEQAMKATFEDEKGDNNAFVDGLCAMLRGINASTSRHIVSSTMGHLITMLDVTQFQYSHELVNLLVSQMEATLEGRPVDAHIHKNRDKYGDAVL